MIRRLFLIISLIAGSFCFYLPNALADKIVLAADNWCPFNCDPKSEKPGYMVEVAQKAFSKSGHTLEYIIVPWERAVKDARIGKYSGVIGAYVDDAPDFIFPENELSNNSDSIFVLKKSSWSYKDISSLSGISLGVIKGYAYGSDELNAYIKKNGNNIKKVQLSHGDSAQEMNIKKLAHGRMDAVIETPAVFWYTANQLRMGDKFKNAGDISKPKKSFIAFSPANPKSKEYARILSNGIDDLRKTDELKLILKKYGLDDWK